MLGVPVIPHHHHADGLICMKNDITADCCEHRNNPNPEHCCCDTGCLTVYFYHQTSNTSHMDFQWDAPWVTTFLYESIFKLLIIPESDLSRRKYVYLESLHGTFIKCATGLRAPPYVLA